MDRALDIELLGRALGDFDTLPSAAELGEALAAAEVELLIGRPAGRDSLLATGWYLFGVACSDSARRRYGVERQRAAFRVASHIFDVTLQRHELTNVDRLQLCLAAQLASVRSDLSPNASAIYRREFPSGPVRHPIELEPSTVVLSIAAALVAMDMRFVWAATDEVSVRSRELLGTWGLNDITTTIFGAAVETAAACRHITRYLVYGGDDVLNRARTRLRAAIQLQSSQADLLSRWVAAQLHDLIDGLESSSVWSALPPDVPANVRRAFALAHPQILQLWPPQVDLFAIRNVGGVHPLSPEARRQLISTPTSGGKTLFAQLLIATHLSRNAGDVCYVAPTRSLCHEVRGALSRRLRYLGARTISDLPVGVDSDVAALLRGVDEIGGVEVMTPERLSYLLRVDARAFLERFTLFVFDEVHNVADETRGWTLESSVAFLHHHTVATQHRLVLISAAIGNRHHFHQWLGGDNDHGVIHFHSDWRGPRRMHCLWTTDAAWDRAVDTERRGNVRRRRQVPLHGILSVRARTGHISSFRTRESVGTLELRQDDAGAWKRHQNSTPFYLTLVHLVARLAALGPVLIIEASRTQTVRTARALAERRRRLRTPQLRLLTDLVTARLGTEHPLIFALERGVGFHHGSLPMEVRIGIEEAVSDGVLSCLVATTTLTEGVNLPVRSVLIAAQDLQTGEGFDEFITGPRLINAIGRAGRAAKETEGIVVLARQARPAAADFERLQPGEDALHITSRIATEQALNELVQFEALVAARADAVFEAEGAFIPHFIAFVWFLCAATEALGRALDLEQVVASIGSTFGWLQLTERQRQGWRGVTGTVLERYIATPVATRRKWATAGTRLSSAVRLEELARRIDQNASAGVPTLAPLAAMDLVLNDDNMPILLSLAEAPRRQIYNRRSGAGRIARPVPLRLFVRDWMGGAPLTGLAETHLGFVGDPDFCHEQLGDVLNDYKRPNHGR